MAVIINAYFFLSEYHTYQLRAYLYQARWLYSSDRTSNSDPYAVVSFETFSSRSLVVEDSISPMWDQTIVSGQVKIFGDAQSVLKSPPPVVLEFYDKDRLVCGTCVFVCVCVCACVNSHVHACVKHASVALSPGFLIISPNQHSYI